MATNDDSAYDQAYGRAFAGVYNQFWSHFSERAAPQLASFFEADSGMIGCSQTLLDLCCGTGQLASDFLSRGYRVAGIDLSPSMVELAIKNNQEMVNQGQATFLVADAASFRFDKKVSFVVSIFDALNHLPDENALKSSFSCVWKTLNSPGLFVFDLNTPNVFEQRWNGMELQDTERVAYINRGIYAAGSGRAFTSITGFVRTENGLYERFTQKIFETVFDLDRVIVLLTEVGFGEVYVASAENLKEPVADMTNIERAVFVCRKN